MTLQQVAQKMKPIAFAEVSDNMKKFLMLLTFTEGTYKHKNPYHALFGHGEFEDEAKHPNKRIPFGKNNFSTAAGRYQFLYKTYKTLGMKNMTPMEQDKGAIKLIKWNHALNFIKNGNFEDTIIANNKTWASLPFSPYGQPTHDMDECLEFLSYLD